MRLLFFTVGLCGLLLLLWFLFGLKIEAIGSLSNLTHTFEAAKNWAWLLGILLLIADLVLPIPGTLVMSALGAVYGFFLGGIFAAIGSMLAGLFGYGMGRFFREERAKQWLGEKDFEKGRWLLLRYGAWLVAVSRALPILPEVLASMAGLLRMPLKKFVIALACGALPMGFLFASIGHYGKAAPSWGIFFSLLFPALLWALASYGRKKSE